MRLYKPQHRLDGDRGVHRAAARFQDFQPRPGRQRVGRRHHAVLEKGTGRWRGARGARNEGGGEKADEGAGKVRASKRHTAILKPIKVNDLRRILRLDKRPLRWTVRA